MTTIIHPFPDQLTTETAIVDSHGNGVVDGNNNLYVILAVEPAPLAQYKLLYQHYIADMLLEAGTIIEVPTNAWSPTYQVDPLNAAAIAAFRANGPPHSEPDVYQPSSYAPFEIVPQIYWKNGVLVGA